MQNLQAPKILSITGYLMPLVEHHIYFSRGMSASITRDFLWALKR